MKFLRLTFLMALLVGFVGFSSCGPGNEPTPSIQEAQLKKLEGTTSTPITWALQTVTLDGVDKKTEYTSFTLKLDGTFSKTAPLGPYNYTVSGTYPTSSPWPPSKIGTWVFSDTNPETEITRDKDSSPDKSIIMTYSVTSGTSAQLQLSFDYQRDGSSGRVSSVKGQWIMTFKPQ